MNIREHYNKLFQSHGLVGYSKLSEAKIEDLTLSYFDNPENETTFLKLSRIGGSEITIRNLILNDYKKAFKDTKLTIDSNLFEFYFEYLNKSREFIINKITNSYTEYAKLNKDTGLNFLGNGVRERFILQARENILQILQSIKLVNKTLSDNLNKNSYDNFIKTYSNKDIPKIELRQLDLFSLVQQINYSLLKQKTYISSLTTILNKFNPETQGWQMISEIFKMSDKGNNVYNLFGDLVSKVDTETKYNKYNADSYLSGLYKFQEKKRNNNSGSIESFNIIKRENSNIVNIPQNWQLLIMFLTYTELYLTEQYKLGGGDVNKIVTNPVNVQIKKETPVGSNPSKTGDSKDTGSKSGTPEKPISTINIKNVVIPKTVKDLGEKTLTVAPGKVLQEVANLQVGLVYVLSKLDTGIINWAKRSEEKDLSEELNKVISVIQTKTDTTELGKIVSKLSDGRYGPRTQKLVMRYTQLWSDIMKNLRNCKEEEKSNGESGIKGMFPNQTEQGLKTYKALKEWFKNTDIILPDPSGNKFTDKDKLTLISNLEFLKKYPDLKFVPGNISTSVLKDDTELGKPSITAGEPTKNEPNLSVDKDKVLNMSGDNLKQVYAKELGITGN